MSSSPFLKWIGATALTLLSVIAMADSSASYNNKLKRVGYFTSWSIYHDYTSLARENPQLGQYEIADVPGNRLTHLIYAYADIAPVTVDGQTFYECTLADPWGDSQFKFDSKKGLPNAVAGNLERLLQLKAKHEQLKLLLSIGGWKLSHYYSQALATQEQMSHFAHSCIALMNQHSFDGLDFDWEFPVLGGKDAEDSDTYSPEDKQHFTNFLSFVKQYIGRDKELTVAAMPLVMNLSSVEVKAVSDIVDAMHLMAYDYREEDPQYTGYLAPLYPASKTLDQTNTETDRVAFSADAVVQAYLKAGADPSKLVLGVPLYGRAWRVIDPQKSVSQGRYELAANRIDQKASGVDGNWEDGKFDYWKIQRLIRQGHLTEYYDKTAQAPYAFSPETGMAVTYENKQSVNAKVDYIVAKGLGGIMFWDVGGDVRGDRQTMKNSLIQGADMRLKSYKR
jgi:chitinase